eukprot:scaffold148_cov144-Isochrysis_galbana.AAC.9
MRESRWSVREGGGGGGSLLEMLKVELRRSGGKIRSGGPVRGEVGVLRTGKHSASDGGRVEILNVGRVLLEDAAIPQGMWRVIDDLSKDGGSQVDLVFQNAGEVRELRILVVDEGRRGGMEDERIVPVRCQGVCARCMGERSATIL